MGSLFRIIVAALIFSLVNPAPARAEGFFSSVLHNDWESTDWLSVGLVLPAPSKHCEEENNQPPCHRVKGVAAVARVEAVRFRYERFQWNLISIFLGQSWVQKEYLGFGILSLGGHWPLTDDKVHEIGFMTQPLGIFMGTNAWGNLKTSVYYRHNWSSTFLETGMEFAPIWDDSPLGDSGILDMRLEDMPIHLYISTGF